MWFVFVFVLFLLNCFYKWKIYRMILEFKLWKFIVFLLIGFIGGGFLVIVGSGVDVCSFSVLMFFFLSEWEDCYINVCYFDGRKYCGGFLLVLGYLISCECWGVLLFGSLCVNCCVGCFSGISDWELFLLLDFSKFELYFRYCCFYYCVCNCVFYESFDCGFCGYCSFWVFFFWVDSLCWIKNNGRSWK